MTILARIALILLGLLPGLAFADSRPYTLQCDTGRHFPTGVNSTMTERTDLVAFKDWCERAGTATVAITMTRNGDTNVFESAEFGSTLDQRATNTRARTPPVSLFGTLLPRSNPLVRTLQTPSRNATQPAIQAAIQTRPQSTSSAPQTPIAVNFQRFDAGGRLSSGSKIDVVVDVSEQAMRVSYNGRAAYRWPVSTARPGKVTPRGSYGVQWLSRDHRSSIYDGAPMPFAIFFNGNFAIHGTDKVQQIGRPASAGCVRLLPADAERLFEAVRVAGRSNVSIRVVD